MQTTNHTLIDIPGVAYAPGTRYPHRAMCTCGWEGRGYLTHEAAKAVAEDHATPTETTPLLLGQTDGVITRP